MANPRKFSEKIALHNQKQAEETAAFEAIMREVVSIFCKWICVVNGRVLAVWAAVVDQLWGSWLAEMCIREKDSSQEL